MLLGTGSLPEQRESQSNSEGQSGHLKRARPISRPYLDHEHKKVDLIKLSAPRWKASIFRKGLES